jgi:hypothetical protein
VARAIERGEGPVLLVVGRFHVDFEGALVQALGKPRAGTRAIVVSFVDEAAPVDGTIREEHRGRADFVIYVGPSW